MSVIISSDTFLKCKTLIWAVNFPRFPEHFTWAVNFFIFIAYMLIEDIQWLDLEYIIDFTSNTEFLIFFKCNAWVMIYFKKSCFTIERKKHWIFHFSYIFGCWACLSHLIHWIQYMMLCCNCLLISQFENIYNSFWKYHLYQINLTRYLTGKSIIKIWR